MTIKTPTRTSLIQYAVLLGEFFVDDDLMGDLTHCPCSCNNPVVLAARMEPLLSTCYVRNNQSNF